MTQTLSASAAAAAILRQIFPGRLAANSAGIALDEIYSATAATTISP
jgi:hypothetical protein